MEPGNQSLLDSEEWKTAVAGKRSFYGKIARRLAPEDVAPLLEVLEAGPPEERRLAMYLLYRAVIQKILFSQKQKERLIARVRPMMAAYPHQPGPDAFCLIFRVAPDIAEQFLLDDVDVARISERNLASYLWDVAKIESPMAMDRLKRYSYREGKIGEKATKLLALLGRGSD